MNTWNLREDASYKTKIANDLYWIPANYLNKFNTKNINISDEPHNLYELLFLFQQQNFEECYDNRLLKHDEENSLTWELFENPSLVVEKYRKGNCAMFSLWLSYYLNKMYEDVGYIKIIRNKNKSWHVINYVHIDDMYYIVDPSIFIKKYSQKVPVEDGKFKTYSNSNIITGGILQTSSLEKFVIYYQKYVSLANGSYLFIKFDTYDLPKFSISDCGGKYSIYYPKNVELSIIGKYDPDIYSIVYI